jgi:hypothetical protein
MRSVSVRRAPVFAALLALGAAMTTGACKRTSEGQPPTAGEGGGGDPARAVTSDAGDAALDDPAPVVATKTVQDFEKPIKLGKWPMNAPAEPVLSSEWATDGKQSLKIEPGLLAHFQELAERDWTPYSMLRLHVRNTGAKTATLLLELQDEHRESHERHWNEIGVPPGDQVVDFDIAGALWRGTEDFPYRGEVKTPINKADIRSVAFKNRGDAVVFVDQVEVVKTKVLDFDGAYAFDLGPENSRVMRQTTGVFETTIYTPERRYGFVAGPGPGEKKTNSLPTPMLGDGLAFGADSLRVDLPGGAYVGWIAFERGGFWENRESGYEKATVKVNGKPVSEHAFARNGTHFLFEDTEVSRVADMTDKLIWPAHAIQHFSFDAAKGANDFSLDVLAPSGAPLRVAGLVIAPATAEGRAYLAAHEKLQRLAIARSFAPLDRSRRGDARTPPAAKLVVQAMSPGEQMAPGDWPLTDAPALAPQLAALGQKLAIQLGVYAKDAATATVTATPLASQGAPEIPITQVSHGRYLPTRANNQGPAWIEIDHYRPEPTFAVGPDLARSVVVEIEVPETAKPGDYTSTITVDAGGEAVKVPVRVRVVPARLAAIPIPVCFLKDAPPFAPDVVGQDAWWKLQESFLREQGEAGLNCVTGGPGLQYDVGATEGPYTFRGDAPLRYLALAKKYGLDRAVVAYGAFVASMKRGMLPMRDRTPADPKRFVEGLLAFEKKNDLPPHYLYAYDEPSADHERELATGVTEAFSRAGGRTLGFTSIFWGNPVWEKMVEATNVPCLMKHDPADIAKLKGQGKHPWLYGTGPSRFGFGVGLWRSIQVGVEGRLEWVGTLTNGFAFYDFDGRSASGAAWRVHSRYGLLETPKWLASREGLTDLRVRLALEAKAPKGDPALGLWTTEGYSFRGGEWPAAKLDETRKAMLERLEALAGKGAKATAR